MGIWPNRSGRSVEKKVVHCTTTGCEHVSVSTVSGDALCRRHFIDICYSRLERYEELREQRGLSLIGAEAMRRFIHECSRQADEIEHTATDLDNLDRAKLLHIILTASELGRFLRRRPQKVAGIP